MSVLFTYCLSYCLIVCLSVLLSYCLSVLLSVCLFYFMSYCLAVLLSFCVSYCVPYCMYIVLLRVLLSLCRVCLPYCLSICMRVSLFVCLSVCQYLSLSVSSCTSVRVNSDCKGGNAFKYFARIVSDRGSNFRMTLPARTMLHSIKINQPTSFSTWRQSCVKRRKCSETSSNQSNYYYLAVNNAFRFDILQQQKWLKAFLKTLFQ